VTLVFQKGIIIAFIHSKKMILYNSIKLEQIRQLLTRREETIAVAESVTAGFLQAALSQAEEASSFFQGGITVYNLGQKYRHLKVEPIHAQFTNCVSSKVAAKMAIEVCSLFGCQWGLAITGYATPVPESAHKIFAFYAIAKNGKPVKQGKISGPKGKEAFEVQQYFLTKVLDQLLEQVR
jgi:PncC family amidohydrolase